MLRYPCFRGDESTGMYASPTTAPTDRKPRSRDRSTKHDGAASLRMVTAPHSALEGPYLTSRCTAEDISLKNRSAELLESFPEAQGCYPGLHLSSFIAIKPDRQNVATAEFWSRFCLAWHSARVDQPPDQPIRRGKCVIACDLSGTSNYRALRTQRARATNARGKNRRLHVLDCCVKQSCGAVSRIRARFVRRGCRGCKNSGDRCTQSVGIHR